MTYATQATLETAFGVDEILQLTDRDQNGSVDAAFLAAALARADAVIDSYLGRRYTVPITPTPTVVLGIAADLARHYLYEDAVPEPVRAAYDDALRWLQQAGRGEVCVAGATAAAAATGSGGVFITSETRVFSRELT